jgi:predicted ATP-grasp superfamily ATP-dependent carboligase
MPLVPAVVCTDGAGINALATVRSLGRRGVPVHVVCVADSPQIASYSRYCTSHTPASERAALFGALRQLSQRLRHRPVLYIDNDAMMQLLLPHADALQQHFEVVDPLADAARLTDKAFQLRVAQDAGIAVPRTWFPGTWTELNEIGRQTAKRLIIKPSPRKMARAAAFKVAVCPSAPALAALLRRLGASPDEVLVQEYVEGDDAQIYVGLCYRAGDQRCFLMSARKLRQTQPGAGVMAVGQAVDAPAVRDLTRSLAEALGLRGVICTEFKLDPTDGRLYFIEWNPRPAYFHSLGWQAGFDLAYIAYCDRVAAERLPPLEQSHAASHYWVNFAGDLQHLAMTPGLALRPATWTPYLRKKEWAVFARDDPQPWARSAARFAAALPRALARQLAARYAPRAAARRALPPDSAG